MSSDDRPVEINISGIPVAGVGGLGLVAVAALMAYVMPVARWSIAAGLAGGALLAVILVFVRRHWKIAGPSGDDPKVLFRPTAAEPAPSSDRPFQRPSTLRDWPAYSSR